MKGHIFKIVAAVLWMLCHVAHAGTVTYVYTDPQGTPLAEADASGNITARFDYAPYGTAVASLSPAPNGPGYTGHVNDPDTGLVYMQARYYQPDGRFLSPDPVGPSPGNLFSFNRYEYANNNPIVNIDPTGKTCHRSGSKGDYSCQIDYVVERVKDKIEIRAATSADHKTYAAVEKSLTNAVNVAATSGKTASISVRSGGNTFAFKISGTRVAQNLVGRSMIVDPNERSIGAMYSIDRHDTYINKGGVNPGGHTEYGDASRTRAIEFLHEGIHWSYEEERAFGNALPILATDPHAHQEAYNNAASELMEH